MSIPPPNPPSSPPPSAAPYCARCGAPNPDGFLQCAHCGQDLHGAAWPPSPYGNPVQGYPPPTKTIGGLEGLIPVNNPAALTAYYLGIFSFIPCLGLPLGIGALVLGLRGLSFVKLHPEVKGRTHALVGVTTGSLFGALNLIGIIAAVIGLVGVTR